LSLRCESLHHQQHAEYIANNGGRDDGDSAIGWHTQIPGSRTDRVLREVSAASRALMAVGELVLACVSSGSDKICLNLVAENLSGFSLLLTGLDES